MSPFYSSRVALTLPAAASFTTSTASEYPGRSPWNFARISEPEVAREVIAFFNSKPMDQHTTVVQQWARLYREDIERVAANLGASERLLLAEAAMRGSPLTDNTGEGVHRQASGERWVPRAGQGLPLGRGCQPPAGTRPGALQLAPHRGLIGPHLPQISTPLGPCQLHEHPTRTHLSSICAPAAHLSFI